MARDAGLFEIEIAWIAGGPDTPSWNAGEASLLRAVDELVFDGAIGDSTWAALTEHMSAQEILDIIFTVGAYTTVAWMLDSLGIELDADLRRALASKSQSTGKAESRARRTHPAHRCPRGAVSFAAYTAVR
jgi:hypothetical protein